jgi:hypothetical protein
MSDNDKSVRLWIAGSLMVWIVAIAGAVYLWQR